MKDRLLLMSTRLKMPQPRKNYIVREELFARLDRMNEYSVILVKGGLGTGKTTLITSYAREKLAAGIKWVSLDESCNNVFVFWSYFIETVGEYLGEARQDFLTLYAANYQKSNLEQLLTILINGLDKQEDIFVALDDFHHLTDGFLMQTVEFFVRHMPDNVHLILLTRQEPLLYTGGLSMQGKLLVIDEQDLKLSTAAGLRFLTDTLQLNLKLETLGFMNQVAEGWVGGLQLLAAAAGAKSEAEIKGMNIETRLVGDYLTREIYDLLSREEKDFLVLTSIFSYFYKELCVKLIDGLDYRKMMAGLLQKNILITCLDEENGVYRYHHILREYLRGRFKELGKEKQIQLHLKAAEILNALGDSTQCIDQLLLAGDYTGAMQQVLDHPQNMTLFSYVDRIPGQYIARHQDFAYHCFFYYYANMEFEKCRWLYDLFKANMAESSFATFEFFNLFLEGSFKINELNMMPVSEIDKLPLKDTTKSLILIRDAALLCTQCRYDEAMVLIERAAGYAGSSSNPFIGFFSFSIKSQILEGLGELNKCLALYEEMNKILASNKQITMFNTSYYIGKAGVHLKQMDLQSAANCLDSGAEYITDFASPTSIGYKYNQAEYKFLVGDTEAALEQVKELLSMEAAFSNLLVMNSLLQYIFRLNNFAGELVQRFIDDYAGTAESCRSLDSKLVYAGILFIRGEVQAAVELVDQVLKYSRRRKIKLMIVQASLVKINMIFDNPDNKRDLINLFREALYYSSQIKYCSPIIRSVSWWPGLRGSSGLNSIMT